MNLNNETIQYIRCRAGHRTNERNNGRAVFDYSLLFRIWWRLTNPLPSLWWNWDRDQQGETVRRSADGLVACALFVFVGRVTGWTGWERAAASVPGTALPQYWLDRSRRRLLHAAAAAAAPVFVVEGPASPRPHEPNGYCFFPLFFFILPYFFFCFVLFLHGFRRGN